MQKNDLRNVYVFRLGMNLYTLRLSDIRKVTLLEHRFIEQSDDTTEIKRRIFIFSVYGKLIPNLIDDRQNPIYEQLLEIKGEEEDYEEMFKTYMDLLEKWDNSLGESSIEEL